MTALQVFTAIPKFYGDKSTIKPERVARFKAALAKTKIKPANVVVHAAYVLSVATPDDEKFARASAGLTKELERSSALGVGAVCFHPGSAGTSDRADSAKRIAKAITDALKTIESDTRLLVENTAGAGKTMGKTAQEVKRNSLARAEVAERENRLRARHLPPLLLGLRHHRIEAGIHRGARRIRGSHRRAALLLSPERQRRRARLEQGSARSHRGRAHWEAAVRVADAGPAQPSEIPLILETPQQNYEIADDDESPDPYDVKMMKLLEGWASE